MEVKLEAFEGPLDLLLQLIRRSQIDIYDIPIARVTAEYLETIANLPPDMGEMSEFLVMAATLLEIKSKMLLPRPKIEGEPVEDPREALARRLLVYQQTQVIAAKLGGLNPIGEWLTGSGERELLEQLAGDISGQPVMDLVSLPQLADIFENIMRRCAGRIDTVRAGYGEMPRERFTVPEKVKYIIKTLQNRGRLSLSSLFLRCHSKGEMIVTFLALLEMVRCGMINAVQPNAFGDVEVSPCPA